MTKRDAPLTFFGNGLPTGSAVVLKSRFRLYSASPIPILNLATRRFRTIGPRLILNFGGTCSRRRRSRSRQPGGNAPGSTAPQKHSAEGAAHGWHEFRTARLFESRFQRLFTRATRFPGAMPQACHECCAFGATQIHATRSTPTPRSASAHQPSSGRSGGLRCFPRALRSWH